MLTTLDCNTSANAKFIRLGKMHQTNMDPSVVCLTSYVLPARPVLILKASLSTSDKKIRMLGHGEHHEQPNADEPKPLAAQCWQMQ